MCGVCVSKWGKESGMTEGGGTGKRLTLVKAELGTCAPTAMMNRIHVLGSRRKAMAWSFLKAVFLTPWRLAATRSTATARSRSVRNLAVDGRSGSTSSDTTPHATEHAPKMMKTYIHRASEPDVMCPMA